MGADDPLIRASYAKTIVGTIKRRSSNEQRELYARFDEAVRAEIRGHGMLDWMSASRFADLVTMVADALGRDAARDFWCMNLGNSLDRRLLSPLRLGAIAVYGNSPRSLLKMTPQAWELVSRHAGACRTLEQPDGITLTFDGIPPALRIPGMLWLWEGGCTSCVNKMGFRGQVESNTNSLRRGTVDVRVQWIPA